MPRVLRAFISGAGSLFCPGFEPEEEAEYFARDGFNLSASGAIFQDFLVVQSDLRRAATAQNKDVQTCELEGLERK
jgi:hypothetical protein